MRFYISADIEGVPGVVSREHLMPGRFEYEPARDWMTAAVLAVCETARAEGAEEVVVSDSHGNGQNIRFEQMPDYVRLVRSWPRPLGMMQGIEVGAYAGVFLVGYHAGASRAGGVLAHTLSGEFIHDVRLNGRSMSEATLSAAIAGHFGVPVLMIAGDDGAISETRKTLGPIPAAETKTSLGFLSAMMVPPAECDRRLRSAAAEAIASRGSRRPWTLEGPLDLEIRLRSRQVAEWLALAPGIEQVDAFTVRHRPADMVAATRVLQFLTQARGAVS